jgi:hypothetical protein
VTVLLATPVVTATAADLLSLASALAVADT